MLFSEFGLIDPVLKAVEAEGYTTPSPIQAGAIPAALEGKDVLGIAQTGTGKTAAFALPAIHRLFSGPLPKPGARRPIRTLVIAPTRELAMQIRDSFITYGKNTPIRVIAVVGGISQDIQTRALRNGVDALIATPGRLVDLMRQRLIDLSAVEMLILDEADRMFDMGFAPDLKFITGALPAKRQNMLFSATMPGPIAELCRSLLKDPIRVEIKPEKTPMQIIDQCVMIVPRDAKNFTLTAYFRLHEPERAIVFTRTKHGADRVATVLARSGVPSGAIHGDKRQTARMKALADFKSGRIRVLVATDIAARGLGIQQLEAVINVDITPDVATHTHRIGRTGRADQAGWALSLASLDEMGRVGDIEHAGGFTSQWHPLSTLTTTGTGPLRPPMTTLQILGGRKEKIRAGDVLGALTKDLGFAAAQVGKINVNEFSTYVAVERDIAPQVLRRLSSSKIKGRSVKLRLLESDSSAGTER